LQESIGENAEFDEFGRRDFDHKKSPLKGDQGNLVRKLKKSLDGESLDDERLFALMRNSNDRILSNQSWDKATKPLIENDADSVLNIRGNHKGNTLGTFETVEFTNSGGGE